VKEIHIAALLFYAYFIDTIRNSECLTGEREGEGGGGRGGSIPKQTSELIIFSQK
jgi:hypothetical protein